MAYLLSTQHIHTMSVVIQNWTSVCSSIVKLECRCLLWRVEVWYYQIYNVRLLIKYVSYHFYKEKIDLLQYRLPGDAPTREKSAYNFEVTEKESRSKTRRDEVSMTTSQRWGIRQGISDKQSMTNHHRQGMKGKLNQPLCPLDFPGDDAAPPSWKAGTKTFWW